MKNDNSLLEDRERAWMKFQALFYMVERYNLIDHGKDKGLFHCPRVSEKLLLIGCFTFFFRLC